MKKYVASVRDTEGRMTVLRMEYNTKKEFKSDIKANGYTINYSYIFTEEEYNKFINEDAEFMAWFIERLEIRKRNSKLSIEASLGEDVGLKEGVRFEVDYHITEIDDGGNVCSRIATDVVRTWESVMWYKINTRYCGVRIIS